MKDNMSAMRILDTLDEDKVKSICVTTIYNIFGFLGLDKKNTMSRSDLERMLRANIKNIK